MQDLLNRLVRGDGGQDLIEYALLAAVISMSAVATLLLIGPKIDGQYSKINPWLQRVP
jgi:Flp pilus assembly pilin Flp